MQNCKNTKNKNVELQKHKNRNETDLRAPIQFIKSKPFELSQFATDDDHIMKVQSISLYVIQSN